MRATISSSKSGVNGGTGEPFSMDLGHCTCFSRADHASGRDPQGDNLWRQVTGTGIRLNLRALRNTILQVDFGESVLPDVYRGAGSMVLQILLLKPL